MQSLTASVTLKVHPAGAARQSIVCSILITNAASSGNGWHRGSQSHVYFLKKEKLLTGNGAGQEFFAICL
jgi:hypothetical protein